MKPNSIRTQKGFLPCITILALSAVTAHAATLQVDLGRTGEESLQSGWTAWNTNLAGVAMNIQNTFAYAEGTAGTVNVTMTSAGNTFTRNYNNTVTGTQAGLTPLLQDLVFFNAATAASFIQLQIDDLKAGSYTFTGYHHFVQLNTGFPTMNILLNGSDTGMDIQTLQVSSPYEINTLRTSIVDFTVANDNDPVIIRYANPTSTGSNQHFGLNGFELAQSGPDETPPSLVSTIPADGATNVPISSDLVATFSETIALGDIGDVTIRNLTDNTEVIISLGGADPDGTLSVSGTALTIAPALNLEPGDEYAVEVASGAIEDLAGNPFAGISGSTSWNFTTAPPLSGLLRLQIKQTGFGAPQAGWTVLEGSGTTLQTTIGEGAFHGVGVTVSGWATRSGPQGTNYLAIDHDGGDLDHLLSGGQLVNTHADNITLTLTGMADGTYSIKTYHHSPWFATDGVNFDIRLSDSQMSDAVIHPNVPHSYGTPVSTAGIAALVTQFTISGGNGTATLVFDPREAGFFVAGAGDHLNFNGFELAPTGPDNDAPEIVSLTPAAGSTHAPTPLNLVAGFNEGILAGTGFITLMRASDDSVVEAFDVATSPRLTFSTFALGSVTIDPTHDLIPGESYYVLIDPAAITDVSGNAFAGITDATTWSFSGDGTAPAGTGSPDVTAGGNLTLSFDEEVMRGSGNIVIRRSGDGSIAATIDVTTAGVVINGSAVTIQPGFLDPATSYYVEIDSGAFLDLSGNPFAGFSGDSDWTFSTPDTSLAGVPPAGGTSLGAAFETWLAEYPDLGTHVGPYHNADGSRFNNFAEFAFNGHPLVQEPEGTSGSLNTVDAEKTFTFTVPVRDGAVFTGGSALTSEMVDGVTYVIEGGRNLSDWEVVPSEVTGSNAAAIQSGMRALSPGWSYRTFRMPGSTSDEPRMFFRAVADDVPVRIEQARASAPIAGYALGKVKRWLHEVALPKINGNDLYVSHNGGSARYSSWWNYDDTAADTYPFLFWAAWYTDIDQVYGPVHDVLVAEQLHCNLNDHPTLPFGRVPTAVNPTTLVKEIRSASDTMFAASEYQKDGLIAIVEVAGKDNPWFDRMQGIADDMWANAFVSTPYGLVPTSGTEADGEQLQVLARLFTMTGDPKYLDWAERIADKYLLPGGFVPTQLRDHGAEIIGGLGILYAVQSVHRPAKAETYRPHIEFMLDQVLARGTNADGLMFNRLDQPGSGLSDGWGYNYVAYLCHDMVVSSPRYTLGLQQTLRNLAKPLYKDYDWERGSIDGWADSIEGAFYQLNRLPVPEGIAWADQEMAKHVTRTQNPNVNTTSLWGTYKLDSNGVRTVIQHALMHTRGLIARPWNLDLQLGAAQTADGVVVSMTSGSPYSGVLVVDKPRHRLEMGFTRDWPRMNTMPEWFVAEPEGNYIVEDLDTGAFQTYTGTQLHDGLPVTLEAGVETLLLIRPE